MSEPIRKRKGKAPADLSQYTGEVDMGAELAKNMEKKFEAEHAPGKLSDLLVLPGLSLEGKFVFQYLLGTNVLPFNRQISLQGKPGEGKSTAGWIISEMVCQAGGFTAVVETEDKPNVDQIDAILSQITPEQYSNSYAVMKKNKTTELMLSKMSVAMKTFDETSNREVPGLLLVDSFSQPTSEKTKKQVEKDGVAATGFNDAQKAKVITDTFKAMADQLTKGPFIQILIHQEKTAIDTSPNWGGNAPAPKASVVGGDGIQFKDSIAIGITKHGREDTVLNGSLQMHKWHGIKMSTGPDRRVVPVYVRDRLVHVPPHLVPEGEDPDTYQVRFIDIDWGHSLMKLIDNIYQGYNKDGISVAKVKEITKLGMTKTKAWSSKFGISQADAVSWSEMGDIIQNDEETVRALQDIMHIGRHEPWEKLIAPRRTARRKLRRTAGKLAYWTEEHVRLKEEKAPKQDIAYAKKRMDTYKKIADIRDENLPDIPYYDAPKTKVVRKPTGPSVRRTSG
jgi:hypothetical protein